MINGSMSLVVCVVLMGCGGTAESAPGDGAAPPIDGSAADASETSTQPDTSTPDAADASADHSSCAALHTTAPQSPSGTYLINWDGTPKITYCDMTTSGGGWTAFFIGQVGFDLVFARFETDTEKCPDPALKCLRRLPTSTSVSTAFMAQCGGDAIKFNLNGAAYGYFASGTQAIWQPLQNVTAAAGSPNLMTTTKVFTGVNGNLGWIISSDDKNPAATPNTFASSYSFNGNWDFCNGIAGHGSSVKLLFR